MSEPRLRIALFSNMMEGGALHATRGQFQWIAARHTVDFFSLSTSAGGGNALSDICSASRSYDYGLCSPKWRGSLHPLGWIMDFKRMASLQRRIAEDINHGDYDVCVTTTCPFFDVPAINQWLAVPTVYFSHSICRPRSRLDVDWERNGQTLNPLAMYLDRILAKSRRESIVAADFVMANSFFAKEELSRLYEVESLVSYIAVRTDEFYPIENSEKAYAVLGVGVLSPFKAHDFSIRSLAAMPEGRRPELWLAYHAERPGEKDRLTELAESLRVSLRFFGGLSVDQLRAKYNEVLATVFPSYSESLGLVPLESMACGTPVVGIAEGGIRETILDGVTGYLTSRDPEEFADRILDIIENSDVRNSMGLAGRKRVEVAWSWDWLGRQLEKRLLRAAEGKR